MMVVACGDGCWEVLESPCDLAQQHFGCLLAFPVELSVSPVVLDSKEDKVGLTVLGRPEKGRLEVVVFRVGGAVVVEFCVLVRLVEV